MKQELEVLEELDHPHVVRVIELLESPSQYFIVMEYLSDGNLLDFLNDAASNGIRFTERHVANMIH